jgi:hypothetical protein
MGIGIRLPLKLSASLPIRNPQLLRVSVGDLEPDRIRMFLGLLDPDLLVSSGSGSFPFLSVLSGLKECEQNKILTQNSSQKLYFEERSRIRIH